MLCNGPDFIELVAAHLVGTGIGVLVAVAAVGALALNKERLARWLSAIR